MIYLQITTTVLAFLLIVLFIRTFRKTSLKSLLQNAKNGAIIDQKRKKAVLNGEKEFTFERGKVVIYAKTEARAIYEYDEFKKKKKAALRNLKSV